MPGQDNSVCLDGASGAFFPPLLATSGEKANRRFYVTSIMIAALGLLMVGTAFLSGLFGMAGGLILIGVLLALMPLRNSKRRKCRPSGKLMPGQDNSVCAPAASGARSPSPLPARGERPTREAWRVRGSLRDSRC